MKISGIYSITHVQSGRVYIGSSAHAFARMSGHRKSLRSGKHSNTHLQNAWNLYGEKAFVFTLEEMVGDTKKLLVREQAWIDAEKSAEAEYGYNLAPVAGSTLGLKYTEVSRRKLRDVWALRMNRKGWPDSSSVRRPCISPAWRRKWVLAPISA